jgi:hypothetical protein
MSLQNRGCAVVIFCAQPRCVGECEGYPRRLGAPKAAAHHAPCVASVQLFAVRPRDLSRPMPSEGDPRAG